MRRGILVTASVSLLALVLITAFAAAPALADECPTCVKAKKADGWCKHCAVGYQGGEQMKCEECWKACHEPVGACEHCGKHFIGGKEAHCEDCVGAAKTDGACKSCGVWYAHGEQFKCKGCWDAAKAESGKCEHCHITFVQGHGFKKDCCAKAAGSDAACTGCKVWFAHGVKYECKGCWEAAKAESGRCDHCGIEFVKGARKLVYY